MLTQLKRSLSLKVANLKSSFKKIKSKVKNSFNKLIFHSKEKDKLIRCGDSHENMTISPKKIENHSNIYNLQKISLPSTKPVPKTVSKDLIETGEETSSLRKEKVVPEGSRVLSISLMKGQIIEKVYLTPDGEKLSFKRDEL